MRIVATAVIVLCTLAAAPSVAGAAPATIGFSGRLSRGDGVVDGAVSLRFQLFDGATQVWSEEQQAVASDGLVFVALGSVTPLGDALAGDALELEIIVDGEVMSPRLPLTAVPYAARAAVAEDAGHAENADFADSAGNADSLGGLPAAAYVTADQACAVDSVITAIDADGNVSCTGVSRAQIVGNEVQIYRETAAGCSERLTTSSSCETRSDCTQGFLNCGATSCSPTQQTCPNEPIGYLLAP